VLGKGIIPSSFQYGTTGNEFGKDQSRFDERETKFNENVDLSIFELKSHS